MTATLAPPQPTATPPAPTYRRVAFPAPLALRVPHVRRLLGGLPLGVAPLGFLGTFVTLMTYVPGCSGDDITSSTTVDGSEVLAGRAQAVWTPAPVQQGLHAAAPWSHAVLAACLLFAVLVLMVPRYPGLAAGGCGIAVLVLLTRMEQELGSGHHVHVQAEVGENVIWLAGALSAIAGLAMHGWRRRPITPWARCAGFWRRLIAFCIDSLVLAVVTALIAVGSQSMAAWVALLLMIAYWPAWEASRYRATLGKQAIGLVVAMDDGARVSLMRCAVRHVLRILSIVTLLGAAIAGFTECGQAFHDYACKTVVVRGVEPLLDM
jgi:uncharacterized RDD family membrane protein YckC